MGFFDTIGAGLGGFLTGGPWGAGLAIGGSLLQNYNQGKTDNSNYQAQLAQQQYIQGLIQKQMGNMQNPYAQNLGAMAVGKQLLDPISSQQQQVQGAMIDPSMLSMMEAPRVGPIAGVASSSVQAPSLGATPRVQIPDALSYLMVNSPQVMNSQINPGFGAQMIGNPGQVAVPQIGGPQFGSDFNMGQDALMQMLRTSPGQQRDTAMEGQLRSMFGDGGMQDLSALLGSQDAVLQNNLAGQVSALRGSAGSLGQRFGSELRGQEGKLRSDFLTQSAANRQNTLAQAFESAQGRKLQALGLGSQNLQAANQFGLQGAQLQQGAAQQLLSSALQAAQLGQGAQFQNAANLLQAQGINVNAALQASTANQSAGLQAQGQNLQALLANQSSGLQASQTNAANALQAALANQQTGLNAGQSSAQMALQAALANQSAGLSNQQLGAQQALQAALANQSNSTQNNQFTAAQQLQAMLANQQMAGQFGMQQGQMNLQTLLANQASQNQTGQFNASNFLNTQQLTSQNYNQYNQQLLQALSGAGQLQQGQQGLQNQLIGMLTGQQIPTAPTSGLGNTIGDIGQLMMLLPYLKGNGGATASVGQAPPTLKLPNIF